MDGNLVISQPEEIGLMVNDSEMIAHQNKDHSARKIKKEATDMVTHDRGEHCSIPHAAVAGLAYTEAILAFTLQVSAVP